MRLRIIDVAGEDLHFADALRGMIWHAYCKAGQPFGPSKEAMFLWMEHQLQLEDGA